MEVLLIDDNALILELQKALLENFDLTVDIASSGELGISMAREHEYDLIFMDIQMPGLNGFETAEQIRRFNTEVEIIALSADAIAPSDEAFVASGMNGALRKPLDSAAIEALLEHKKNANRKTKRRTSCQLDAIFDYEELAALLGSERAVVQVLQEFLTVHHNDCDELTEAVNNGDFLRAREIMHDIVGISGNLYCRRLYDAAKRLGAELRQGQADSLPLFTGVWKQTVSKLAKWQTTLRKSAGNDAEMISDWPRLWQDFSTLAAEFDVRATELFWQNIRLFFEHMEEQEFFQLRTAAGNYDYLWIWNHKEELHVHGIDR